MKDGIDILNERIAELEAENKRLRKYIMDMDKQAYDHTEGGELFVTVPKTLFEECIEHAREIHNKN